MGPDVAWVCLISALGTGEMPADPCSRLCQGL